MKFSITSDIQLHNHQLWSKPTPDGFCDRFIDGLKCLEEVFKIQGNSKGAVIINGDLFHDRKAISLDVLHATRDLLNKYQDTNLILNVGNHDQFLRRGEINSMSICNGPNTKIFQKEVVGEAYYEGIKFYIIPFIEDSERFKELVGEIPLAPDTLNVLLMHQGVDGALLAKNSKAKGKIALSDLRLYDFDLVLSGHYHKPQKMADNFFYIGSPYEIDEGEAGDEKRFLVLSDEPSAGTEVWGKGDFKLYSIPVLGMPKHLKFDSIKAYEDSPYFNERHFVSVICKDDEEIRESRKLGVKTLPEPITESDGVMGGSEGELSIPRALEISLTSKKREDLLAIAKIRTKC